GGSLLSGYNSVNNSGTGNISLNAGASSWFARLSGSLRKADNTKTPAGTLLNSQYQDNSLSADVAVKPIENQELKISFQRVRAENVGIPGGNSLFSSIAEVRYPSEERQLLKAEYNLHNISGTLSNVSIRYYYQYILRDVENIPHTVSKTPAQGSQPAKETDVLKITPNARHYTNGLQLQTDWVTGKQNFIIAGIDAWQRKLDSRRERYIRVLTMNAKGDSVAKTVNQIVGERPLPESSFRSIGLYLQDELELIKDELKITLGGRFDQIHVTNQEVSNPVYLIVNGQRNDAPATRTIYWKEGKENNYSWSGNLGLLYSVSQGLNLNFTAARSFRSPSLEERYKYIDLGSLVQLGDPALKPEEGLFLDAGLRVFDDRLSCTFDAFLNSLTNMVAEKPGTYEGRPALINSNIGKARLYGFDLGADYYVTGRVNLYTTASLVSGRDIEKDQYLPQVPPFNGKLGVRVPVYEYGEVDFSGTVFSAQNNVAAGEIKTPGYTYFDLYLNSAPVNFGDIKLKFYGGVENLTDKAYRNHLATNRGLTAIEPGRNFFVKCVLAW
ncbi:MAG: TonB-dependent receptor domain-containing protein, partial [Methanococcaceae archaeon]